MQIILKSWLLRTFLHLVTVYLDVLFTVVHPSSKNGGGLVFADSSYRTLIALLEAALGQSIRHTFDPCRLAYLTYTSNDCVRPLSI
jgi:hypothetical protein